MSIQGFYTNKGSALATKIAGGLTALTVTRVVAGSGHTEDIPSATTLPDIKQTLTVGTAVVEGTTATLPVTLAEVEAEDDYDLTELGVYATDPQEGEILMQVYQLSAAQTVTAGGEGMLRFFLRQTIGAQGVTVTCSPAGIVLDEDLDPLRAAIAGKPDAVTSDMEIHVAKTGSDTTGDGSAEHPFLTIQHAVDSLPKLLCGQKGRVTVHGGTYSERVVINGFSEGEMELLGADGEVVSVQTIDVTCCHSVLVFNMNITGNSEDGYNWSFRGEQTAFINVNNVICENTVTSQHFGAFRFKQVAVAAMTETIVRNKNIAVDAVGANVYLSLCTIQGTTALRSGSGYGITGAIIFKGSSTITGTQTKEYGGQIW